MDYRLNKKLDLLPFTKIVLPDTPYEGFKTRRDDIRFIKKGKISIGSYQFNWRLIRRRKKNERN